LWENINNIKLNTRTGEDVNLTLEQKQAVFNYLDNHEKLTATDLFDILGKNKRDYIVNKQIEKDIQGNITKSEILKCLGNNENKWLKLDLNIVETDEQGYLYKKTGEVLNEKPVKYIDRTVEKEPLYHLWHTIYSINDTKECCTVLQNKFGFDNETAGKLANIDFRKLGFGNKSVKAIRKILPYMMEGDVYSSAMSYAGFNHSNSLTNEENLRRKLSDRLKPIEKNSLRQPIVEKILNQMINVVNAIIDTYGRIDETRIEWARELKQSKEERKETDKRINKRQRENEAIAERLAEYGLRATRNNIIKWRLYEEIDNQEKKLNATCIYCGQPISLTDAINGTEVEIEHIIPRCKLFTNSQSNLTLVHRRCNSTKGDATAYDFMKGKTAQEFEAYIERVNSLYTNKIINKTKWRNLLMTESKIPDDFFDRQLRESQYIARKAREILQTICSNVWCTTGIVTAELRRLWGGDDVTMNLQLAKYRELGLTEIVERKSENGKCNHTKEVIKGWTKRDDHRHHAVDALTIACTKQGYIQRFNTLNASKTRDDMQKVVNLCSEKYNEKLSLLEKYIISQRPLSVSEVETAVSKILVSFKSGKKVAVKGTRKIGKTGNKKVIQRDIIIPRGALSEQFIYGKFKTIEKKKLLKYIFENPQLIFKPRIKRLVEERLTQFSDDAKKALDSLKKAPIYLDNDKTHILEYATCFKDEYVKKYDVDVNFNGTEDVIDWKIKNILQQRLDKFGGKPQEAFRDVQKGDKILKWYEDEGLEHPIHSVRCSTGFSVVVPVKKDENGNAIGYVKPGNNHHIAIYTDSNGSKNEHVCTFWHAVERKKFGVPIVIKDTNELWDKILQKPEGSYPQNFLEQLPHANWKLLSSLQQNEMFVLNLTKEELTNAMQQKNNSLISNHLYVVWSLSNSDYWLRHHLETKNTELKKEAKAKEGKRYYRCKSTGAFFRLNPIKVKINHIGQIVSVGEY
jgi:CRISPR-associated endonuclease Csn1